jgi:ribosome-interacting GTPase 1
MNYKGARIQIIEIPSTFSSRFISLVDSCDGVIVLGDEESKNEIIEKFKNRIKQKPVIEISSNTDINVIKETIIKKLGLIIIRLKDGFIALKNGSTVKDLAKVIHKDFVRHFKYAIIAKECNNRTIKKRVGLHYVLEDGDFVEIRVSK